MKGTTIFVLMLMSIKLYSQEKEIRQTSYIISDSTKYKMDIIQSGNSTSYEALCYIYDFDHKKILPYSLFLAEIHKNENAFLDSYLGLSYIIDNQENMDKEKRKILTLLALYYLKSSLKTHNFSARLELAELYKTGKYVEKNKDAYEYLYNGGYDIDAFWEKQK